MFYLFFSVFSKYFIIGENYNKNIITKELVLNVQKYHKTFKEWTWVQFHITKEWIYHAEGSLHKVIPEKE